jgi:hypothetical protein
MQSSSSTTTTTTTEMDESTVPSQENIYSRIFYNSQRNSLFCDFSRLELKTVEHVKNMRTCLEDVLLSQKASKVDVIVNYDGFSMATEEIVEQYSNTVISYMTDHYYNTVHRYTTKSSKQQDVLKRTSSIEQLEKKLVEKKIRSCSISKDVQKIGDKYVVDRLIGEGSFGKVMLAHVPTTGEPIAIKQIDMEATRVVGIEDFMARELAIMKELSSAVDAHENIIKLYDVITENNDTMYIVLEYCNNGSLDSDNHEPFPEREAHSYFVQIISALEYIHKRNIIHRDLQLQNICLTDNRIKLVDFGLSDHYDLNTRHNVFCGNISYHSPEMIYRDYLGPEVDVWSAGVCLYRMVTGYLPFKNSTNTLSGKLTVPIEEEEYLSEECKDLLKKILNPDPQQRYSLNEIKEHAWFSKYPIVSTTDTMPQQLQSESSCGNDEGSGSQKL